PLGSGGKRVTMVPTRPPARSASIMSRTKSRPASVTVVSVMSGCDRGGGAWGFAGLGGRQPLGVGEAVRDWIAPVAAEGAARDLYARRGLAALVFGAVEHTPDAPHRGFVMAARHDLVHRHFVLDKTFENVVEFVIRRQRVLIGLVRLELGGRRLGDDAVGHDPALGAEQTVGPALVAPARQR